jgi:hypothetical protein
MIVYLYFKDKKNIENCEKINVLFFLNVKCFLKNLWGYPYWKPHNFFLLKICPFFHILNDNMYVMLEVAVSVSMTEK